MRVNIENAAAQASKATPEKWLLEELVRNLKELRDRPDSLVAMREFFDLFVFNDDKEFRQKKGQS